MAVTRNTKYVKEYEDDYVAIVERHTLGGTRTITLMEHKHICV